MRVMLPPAKAPSIAPMDLSLALTAAALALALALRPWRAVPAAGPPWPWMAWWAVLPLFWSADLVTRIPLLQPISGACLLLMMAGWPLAVLALSATAALSAWLTGLDPDQAVARLLWLGLVPISLAFGLGAAIRRWLPHHLFVYILGRGFFSTVIAMSFSGILAWLVQGTPKGIQAEDLLMGRWLSAWADGFITGMFVAIFVAFRPHWLATYSDKLYLPARPHSN